MSEYQYYEFVAVDGPISEEGLRYAQGCSSRAEVSARRWRNVYNFGDFHGSVNTLLKHYDAHFYIANWGTTRLGVAFPEGYLTREAVQSYLQEGDQYDPTLSVNEFGNRLIVWWQRNEEGGWGWTEGKGLIDELIGIREELIRGDLRALFLGWLADFDPDEWGDPGDGRTPMPPIPAGLDRLSPSLDALIEQFPVDHDALTVAARLSQAAEPNRIPMDDAIAGLPISELRALLRRVADGDGSRVTAELNRLTCPPANTPAGQAISRADFAARTLEVREARIKQEAKAAAEESKRKAEERRRHLESVLERADTIWAGLDSLMEEKIASAYDRAAAELRELRDAHEQGGERAEFQARLAAFRERYARRPAMMRRIEKL